MRNSGQTGFAPRIGDDAVKARTGKAWPEWFAILDAAGARALDHKRIVAYLSKHHAVGPWWRQMVTVGYELARGRREKHQKAGGYSISASRTLGVSVAKLFDAWRDERIRRRWLPEKGMVIRKATRNKSMRITWGDKKTNVDVHFLAKSSAKAQVAVEHDRLPSAAAAAAKKAYWAKALDRLKDALS